METLYRYSDRCFNIGQCKLSICKIGGYWPRYWHWLAIGNNCSVCMMLRIVWSDGVKAMKGKLTIHLEYPSSNGRGWSATIQGPQPADHRLSLTLSGGNWRIHHRSVLEELKSPSKLQVSFSLSGFTRGHIKSLLRQPSFTLGLITGTIGINSDTDWHWTTELWRREAAKL